VFNIFIFKELIFFRAGKTFYCARCKSKFSGANAFNRHKETHASGSPQDGAHQPEAVAGTSGMQLEGCLPQAGTSGMQFEGCLPEAGSFAVQVGGADVDPYRIERSGVRGFAGTAATETTYRVRFNDQWREERLADLRRQFNRLFQDLLDRGREGVADNDLLRVIIRHDALNHAVVIPLQAAGEMNVDKIMSKVENVLQSEETLAVDESFQGLTCYCTP